MRMTRLFGKTLRQAPATAETPSHRLLLQSGLVQQLAAGVYIYSPIGWRALRKVEQIIREESDAAGGQELHMPSLHPAELWEESGRREAMGDILFSLRDRRQRDLVLGPTHEEIIVGLFKTTVQSYRDLPVMPYQIQTKFRMSPARAAASSVCASSPCTTSTASTPTGRASTSPTKRCGGATRTSSTVAACRR